MKDEVTVSGAGALIYTPDGRYLMQLRDDAREVSMRGYWGLFGGRLEQGEDPRQALERELREELSLSISAPAAAFTEMRYSLGFAGCGVHHKHFYEVPIDEAQVNRFRLGEGQAMVLHAPQDLAALPNVIPWDLFGVLVHARRKVLGKIIIPRIHTP